MPCSRAAALPALSLLATTLLLVACSAPQQLQVDSAAAPPPPPAPATRVEMTGSAISSYSGYTGVPPTTFQRRLATMPYPMPQYAPGAERFPDAQANRAVLVEEQPVSTFSSDVDTASLCVRAAPAERRPHAATGRRAGRGNGELLPLRLCRTDKASQPFALTTAIMPAPGMRTTMLLHVAVRGYDLQRAERPPMNVVLLVDVSGSMAPQDRLPLLKQGFRLFAQGLREQDRVAIVTYANGTAVALEPTRGATSRRSLTPSMRCRQPAVRPAAMAWSAPTPWPPTPLRGESR